MYYYGQRCSDFSKNYGLYEQTKILLTFQPYFSINIENSFEISKALWKRMQFLENNMSIVFENYRAVSLIF